MLNFRKRLALLICCIQIFSFINVQTVFAQIDAVSLKSIPLKSVEVQKIIPLDIKTEIIKEPELKIEEPIQKGETEIEDLALETKIPEVDLVKDLKSDLEIDDVDLEMMSSSEILTEPVEPTQRTGLSSVQDNFQVNKMKGSAAFSHSLYLPSGRKGLQPKLALSYDSARKNNDSIVGYGWDISQNYISRSSRYGVMEAYEMNEFTINLQGVNGELLSVNLSDDTHGEYGMKVEEAFLKYEFLSGDTWLVTDKTGAKYYFGQTASSRQDDPNNADRVSKWMLDKVEDMNGNWIKYEYFKDAGEIYPKSINYTGHGTEEGHVTVKFLPFDGGQLVTRPDHTTKYGNGFEVTTNYIIDAIEVEIADVNNGHPVLRHELTHQKSGSNERRLLTSVTEIGIDENGVEMSLPSTDFTYSDEGDTRWEEVIGDWDPGRNESCYLAIYWYNYASKQGETGTRMVDINSDGIVDCASAYPYARANINNGIDNFEQGVGQLVSQRYYNAPSTAMMEVNGDGKIDFVRSIQTETNPVGEEAVYLHTGNAGWQNSTMWDLPVYIFVYGTRFANGVKMGDFNGDGLTDLIQLKRDHSITGDYSNPDIVNTYTLNMYINNGNGGWDLDSAWDFTDDMIFIKNYFRYTTLDDHVRQYPYYYYAEIVDVNQDGLSDIVYAQCNGGGPSCGQTMINDGNKGWISVPTRFGGYPTHNGKDVGIRRLDLNADGLNDYFVGTENNIGVYLNTVNEFNFNTTLSQNFPSDMPLGLQYGGYQGVELVDLDGNGTLDILKGLVRDSNGGTYTRRAFLNQASIPDMLIGVSNNRGSETEIEYKPSTHYRDANGDLQNPKLFTMMQTVHKVTHNDLGSRTYESTYDYKDGEYVYTDSHHNDFGGFHEVTVSDNFGLIEKNFFHQGGGVDRSAEGENGDELAQIGKLYRSEIWDANGGQPIKKTQTINKWEVVDLGNGRKFPQKTATVNFVFNDAGQSKETGMEYIYDQANGNLTAEFSLGEINAQNNGTFVDIGNDLLGKDLNYVNNTQDHIVGILYSEIYYDQDNNRLKEIRYFYDDLSAYQASQGNLTSQRVWKGGSDYTTTSYEYNEYGNPILVRDQRGNETTMTYDYKNIYPEYITNAKGHVTFIERNYLNGQIAIKMNPNDGYLWNKFDSLGRLTEVHTPDDATSQQSQPALTTLIVYDDLTIPNIKATYLFASSTDGAPVTSREYSDGEGNVIQVRAFTNEADQYTAVDNQYDGKGRLVRQSLPYFVYDDMNYHAADLAQQATISTYDILNRLKTATNILGTVSTNYNLWETTVTDQENHSKKIGSDAYGRLITVYEYNGSDEYITNYDYSPLGLLIKITDAENNVREFKYDMLGRLTMQQDLHHPKDSKYAIWTYQYDNASNVTRKSVDGIFNAMQRTKSDYVDYTYDGLNRILTENYSEKEGVEITYTYDDANNGLGLLSRADMDDFAAYFDYDIMGRVVFEGQEFKQKAFGVHNQYDLQGRVTAVLNSATPHHEIQYAFGRGGMVVQVSENTSPIIANIEYTPMRQMSHIEYSNGAVTDYEYLPSELYRLTHISTAFGGTVVQDVVYDYDNVNNLLSLVDSSNLIVQKAASFTYDDLSRLTHATATNFDTIYDQSYEYSPTGNMLIKSDVGKYSYKGYDARLSNSLYANPHAVTQAGSLNLGYDMRGNITLMGKKEMHYDYKNKQTHYKNFTSGVRYGYSYNESRIWKEKLKYLLDKAVDPDLVEKCLNGESISNFLILPRKKAIEFDEYCRAIEEILEETYYFKDIFEEQIDEDRNITKLHHVTLNNQQVATIEDRITADGVQPSRIIFHHRDHLGSANADTDDQNILSVADYMPFGETLNDENYDTDGYENSYKFTGQELDEETGLYYYGARYYNPEIGRFMGLDPLQLSLHNAKNLEAISGKKLKVLLTDPQALNGYSYVLNNPLKYVDPSGEFAILPLIGIAIAAIIATPNVVNAPAPGTQIQPARSPADVYVNAAVMTTGYVIAKVVYQAVTGNNTQQVIDNSPTTESQNLSSNTQESFDSYQFRKLNKAIDAYRAESSGTEGSGSYFGTTKPASKIEADALYNISGTNSSNSMNQISTYSIPQGTEVTVGPVRGGTGTQIFIRDAFKKGVEFIKKSSLK